MKEKQKPIQERWADDKAPVKIIKATPKTKQK